MADSISNPELESVLCAGYPASTTVFDQPGDATDANCKHTRMVIAEDSKQCRKYRKKRGAAWGNSELAKKLGYKGERADC